MRSGITLHGMAVTFLLVMGNSRSNRTGISEEMIEEYAQLTYLHKYEIRRIFELLDGLIEADLSANIDHRFSSEQIEKILPQIRFNPFRDSIYRVFSSKQDLCLSFEDILDLCSAFCDQCPANVRAAWAFQIFDFDGDNLVSLDDLIETVQRLTATDDGERQNGIDQRSAEHVARMILKEMDLAQMGGISPQDFINLVSRMPEFPHAFRLKI